MDCLAAQVQNVLAAATTDSREMIMSRGDILRNVPKLLALSQSPDRSFADHNHPSLHFEGQVRNPASRAKSACDSSRAIGAFACSSLEKLGVWRYALMSFGEVRL